ncbi:IS6 family transposase [Ruegeria arenilitoris]|uniref:IS6 family transposase n=1 Tax=Ruegeria arenilitoris TaxID=1173585 RepID=UPI00147E51A2|nr:IS6 family transposase [Ruegeria arenilitoris]
MISLKGCHFPKVAVLYAVYFYLRYTVSYRDLEEIMAERGVRVDHATLNRWVVKYSPIVAARAQSKKRPTLSSWRMDETYIRVRGKWMYLYRAVDKAGNTLDFMLSERRNRPAAARFFAKALSSNEIPSKIVIDKSGANAAGIREVNKILNRFGCPAKIQTVRSKYLNNLIEQDHRFIKRRVRHMCGFKSFRSASATLDGIEVANMIRKQQFPSNTTSGFQLFAEIAG